MRHSDEREIEILKRRSIIVVHTSPPTQWISIDDASTALLLNVAHGVHAVD